MPKHPVTDPITDQEIAFARSILSGTMTDRQAAEAAGLNPNTAAYTKAKPQVRAWMAEHRAAVNETILAQEAEGLRTQQARREQILARLWQLANLDPETTRGSIAGQIKAMSMIVAIEGLIPDRRQTAAPAHAASSAATPPIYVAEPLRQQREAERREQSETIPPAAAQPTPPQGPEPPPQPTLKECGDSIPIHQPRVKPGNRYAVIANPCRSSSTRWRVNAFTSKALDSGARSPTRPPCRLLCRNLLKMFLSGH